MSHMISKVVRWLEKNSRIAWTLTVCYMVLIFLISSSPYMTQPSPLESKEAPIVEHMIEYSILGFLLLGSLSSKKMSDKELVILAISISILYGISDEIHQFFVPGRYCDVIDVLANSVGSFIGVMIAKMAKG
ncbi:MAG: VanZ family protein [Candidatus Altiarchaeota archaeon]|nr:VanZ family protein [Candidatus Altiarchaeota archaeon]MBU4266310.1 VanZ family protein [Candidatus Altiarchaeota archaeon]MBU4341357.1 VanZ family protein [Candidatus Altiarchaeota archaeon]MBU4437422.1 VanZ family protein [Candidatus Altiarchaeota archaeon]